MSWIEVIAAFERAPEDWSPFIEIFREHGCENTLQTDKPPTLSAAVVAVDGADAVVESLRKNLLEAGATEFTSRDLVEENWEENWKQFFKPRRVGNRIVVHPTWESEPLQPGDVQIVLDPGQAFGTGDHPTTRMCLELLERHLAPGATVADIGCGSGILSVAAVKLGAVLVFAVDIEPLSVEVAKENAQLNGVEFEAVAGAGLQALPKAPFDVLVSNIISATLISLAREVPVHLVTGGKWIVSGIIEANWQDVLEAANRAGFDLVDELHENEWVGACLIKR
jgi:ribosomal protein L11 methyltransferase